MHAAAGRCGFEAVRADTSWGLCREVQQARPPPAGCRQQRACARMCLRRRAGAAAWCVCRCTVCALQLPCQRVTLQPPTHTFTHTLRHSLVVDHHHSCCTRGRASRHLLAEVARPTPRQHNGVCVGARGRAVQAAAGHVGHGTHHAQALVGKAGAITSEVCCAQAANDRQGEERSARARRVCTAADACEPGGHGWLAGCSQRHATHAPHLLSRGARPQTGRACWRA